MKELNGGRLLEVHATGQLSRNDYKTLTPQVERLVHDHGKIRVLFEMTDFRGWSPGGLWEDIKFDARHYADVERLALVGDRRWESLMAGFCHPFTWPKMRFFDSHEMDQARRWVESN
ncbi:MAG: STAS/SEC14 domain-containing protein [Verrucomicrobia bacterium]|nr:STAS/SEC14 domain-containing protein [Verrucomicrobiota bacterium]